MTCVVSKISLRTLEQREQLMSSLHYEQMSETPPGLSCFCAIFINCSFEQSWCWWLGLIKHTWENPQKQIRSIRMKNLSLINKDFFPSQGGFMLHGTVSGWHFPLTIGIVFIGDFGRRYILLFASGCMPNTMLTFKSLWLKMY